MLFISFKIINLIMNAGRDVVKLLKDKGCPISGRSIADGVNWQRIFIYLFILIFIFSYLFVNTF